MWYWTCRWSFDRCYDNGDYADLIDSRKEPTAPLSPDEATWLNALLQERGFSHVATREHHDLIPPSLCPDLRFGPDCQPGGNPTGPTAGGAPPRRTSPTGRAAVANRRRDPALGGIALYTGFTVAVFALILLPDAVSLPPAWTRRTQHAWSAC